MKAKLLAFALLGAFVVVACGGDGGSSGTLVEGDNVRVEMFDNRYQFTEIRIPVGGSVTWVGAGRSPHNAKAADDSWSTEDVFGTLDQYEGDEATIVYGQAGEHVFYCTYHGNAEGAGMAGTLIVGDSAT